MNFLRCAVFRARATLRRLVDPIVTPINKVLRLVFKRAVARLNPTLVVAGVLGLAATAGSSAFLKAAVRMKSPSMATALQRVSRVHNVAQLSKWVTTIANLSTTQEGDVEAGMVAAVGALEVLLRNPQIRSTEGAAQLAEQLRERGPLAMTVANPELNKAVSAMLGAAHVMQCTFRGTGSW
jgi:hypothetical protein